MDGRMPTEVDAENFIYAYAPDDYIEKNFGHQTSRFSKYCRGILISKKQLF